MTLTQIKPAGLSKPVDLADNEKIRLGTGTDLQIYHDGSNSYIDDSGTGNLLIRSNQINFDKYTGEALARFRADGSCELYHNNNSKLETQSSGINVTGEVRPTSHLVMNSADNQIIYLGAGNDLQIYHNGSHSFISDQGTGRLKVLTSYFNVTNAGNSENIIEGIQDGAVNLYYNGVKKFETSTGGGTLTGDFTVTGNVYVGNHLTIQDSDGSTDMLKIGTDEDIRIYHYNNNSYIRQHTDKPLIIGGTPSGGQSVYIEPQSGETAAVFRPNSSVDLYYDNSAKFKTDTNGFYCPNNGEYIAVSSNGQAASGRFGYHNDYELYIENVRGTHTKVIWDNDGRIRSQISDGSNLQDRFEVNASGAKLSGNFLPDANDTRNLGSNSYRWNNIYGTHFSGKHTEANTATNAEFRNEHSVYGGGVRFKSNNTYGTLELTNYDGSSAATLVNTTGGWHWSSNLILGQNIAFNGETANANELDDYEEGTFTPVMKFGGGNSGMSIGNVEAIYTKIGRMVYGTIRFTMTGKGSDTGQLTFTGLPHTVADALSSTSVQGGFPIQYLQGNVNAHEIMAYPWESTTLMKCFKRSNQNSTTSDFTDSDITGTFDGRISFFYTTTT